MTESPPAAARGSYSSKVVATIVLIAIVAVSWLAPLDGIARERLEASFKSALVSFAIARTLNGVISVAQGTELAFQPAGVGVVVTAGEILDPLNDLVERFSWLVLVAASSLGVQIVLTEIFAAGWMNVALSIVLGLALVTLWVPSSTRWQRVVIRLAGALVFARFLIVLATLGASLLSQSFLAEREDTAIAFLSNASAAVEAERRASPDESMLDRFGRFLEDPARALDVEARIDRLKAETETAISHVINLIVVYALETVMLPVAMLFVVYAFARSTVRALMRELP